MTHLKRFLESIPISAEYTSNGALGRQIGKEVILSFLSGIVVKIKYRMRSIALKTPNVNPPARKVSAQNIDALFSALVLLLNLHSISIITPDLISILGDIHIKIVMMLDDDPKELISLLKECSIWLIDFLRGKRAGRGNIPWSHWDMREQCPTMLLKVLPFLTTHLCGEDKDGNKLRHIQVIYALLNCHRVIVTPISVNLKTITDPGVDVGNYTEEIKEALDRLGITPESFRELYKSFSAKLDLKVITTAGPNGQATWTAHEDAVAIKSNRVLYDNFVKIANASELEWLTEAMVGCVPTPSIHQGKLQLGAPVAGRIHAIEEWGGKTRLVAIVDYWTQALLTPLHDTVAFLLKRLDSDGTFNQDKIIGYVREWTKMKDLEINSFDLTAATDRLPVELQRQILAYLFGNNEIPAAWVALLTKRLFQAPDGSMISYATGQPMGAKSSFPMLGLTHHVITQIAAKRAGEAKYNKYVILGDDNTQTNNKVGVKYQEFMATVGVPINIFKSVTHVEKLARAGEICKRIFIEGREISAIPVKLLVKAVKAGHLLPDLQNIIHKRGWAISKEQFFAFAFGLSGQRSAHSLILLNALPTSVTGLTEAIEPPAEFKLSSAFAEGVEVKKEHIEAAYTFALVTEQLKRVDALLKSTELMAETVAAMSFPDLAKVWPSHLFYELNDEARLAAIAKLPAINPSHPIALAANSEYERVMSHLNGLRSGSSEMVKKARTGLLDILRNSLHEMWLGESEKTSVVRRTLINRMMVILKNITNMKGTAEEPRVLHFSLLLAYVQRMWSVRWEFAGALHINPVKSKVNISVDSVSSSLKASLKDINILDIKV